ncbi:MAG: hypothetical protein OHK0021_16010 [Bryobacter sp.]
MLLKIKLPANSVLVRSLLWDAFWDAKAAFALASLLTPVSVLAIVVSLWGVLADTGFARQFLVDAGIWSHWQVWLALGLALQGLGMALEKYANRRQTETSAIRSSLKRAQPLPRP